MMELIHRLPRQARFSDSWPLQTGPARADFSTEFMRITAQWGGARADGRSNCSRL